MSIINAVKGFFIGIALVVPGLSGSIFAVVVGIYEDIIGWVSDFTKDIKGAIKFLLPVAVGAGIGILASTKLILWVCESFPFESYMFFIGLVLGSVPLIGRKVRKVEFKPHYLLLSVASFAIIMIITSMGNGEEKSYIAITSLNSVSDALSMIFAGVFSVSLMAIPGVSGSVMLMVIGQYGTVYNAVSKALDMAVYILKGDFVMAGEAFGAVLLILPFGFGAVAGFVVIAKIMNYLLGRFEAFVYYCVAGLIGAAVVTLFGEGISGGGVSLGIMPVVIGVLCLAVGVVCTVFLDKPEEK